MTISLSSDTNLIMPALHKVLGLDWKYLNDSDNCDETIGSFVWLSVPDEDYDRAMKDIALIAYGNDLPGTVERLSKVRMLGSGECPNCGFNRFREVCEGDKCLRCGKVFSEQEY